MRPKNLLTAAGALAVLVCASSSAEASTGRFRITGMTVEGGDTAKVNISYEYGSNPARNFSGDGVKFFIVQSSKEVATADLKEKGTTTLTFKLADAGLKPGDKFSLRARWPNGHVWGDRSSRPAGEATVPGQAQGLALLVPMRPGDAKQAKNERRTKLFSQRGKLSREQAKSGRVNRANNKKSVKPTSRAKPKQARAR